MKHAALALIFLGVVVVLALGGHRLVHLTHMHDGRAHATALISADAPFAWVGVIAALLVGVGLLRVLGGRWFGERVALLAGGVALLPAVISGAGINDLVRTEAVAGRWVLVPAELVLIIGVALMLEPLVRRGSRASGANDGGALSAGAAPASRAPIVIGVALGGLCSTVLAWWVVQSQHPVQACAGATIGSIAAGVVLRLAAPRASASLACVGVLIGALASAAWGVVRTPGVIEASVMAWEESRWLRITPLMWATGALIGVPIGSWWAASLIYEQSAGGGSSGNPVSERGEAVAEQSART